MKFSEVYPTSFAIKLATATKLYCSKMAEGKTVGNNSVAMHIDLVEFQKMAIGGVDYETSLICYHGKILTKKQKASLELIHKTTKPFILGHVSGVLIDALECTKDKTFLESAKMLLGDSYALSTAEGKNEDSAVHLHFDSQDAKA